MSFRIEKQSRMESCDTPEGGERSYIAGPSSWKKMASTDL